jgi:hypothetical protein
MILKKKYRSLLKKKNLTWFYKLKENTNISIERSVIDKTRVIYFLAYFKKDISDFFLKNRNKS